MNLTLGAGLGGQSTVTTYVEHPCNDDSVTCIHPEASLASRFGTMRPRTIGLRVNYDR